MDRTDSAVAQAGASTMRRNDARARSHPAYWAFVTHRVSGIALTLFLPVHFFVLGTALTGATTLDAVLAWTEQPFVQASEVVLVFLLAAHMTGGLRLLLVEFGGWQSSWQPALIAAVAGAATLCALLFALQLV